jgi:hypothetical protein
MDRFCRTDPVLTGQKFRKRCRRVKEHELGGNYGQPGSYRFVRRISTEKRARVWPGEGTVAEQQFSSAVLEVAEMDINQALDHGPLTIGAAAMSILLPELVIPNSEARLKYEATFAL